MFRLFRRTARLLIAAGVLGAACSSSTLLAQNTPGTISTIQVTTSQVRLEAMKVEMALLADHHTFQLPLAVHVGSNCLEIRGRIADERHREQALRVARQACYLPVLDAIEAAVPHSTVQPIHVAAMKRAVWDVLTGTMGDRLQSLEVQVSPHGEVTLTGQTLSVEDKVAASKALRNLPGCQAVFNALSVQAHQQAGHTLTLVTRDGQHAIHGILPASGSQAAPAKAPEATLSVEAGGVQHQVSAHPYIPLPPAPTPTIPSGLPPAREVYVRLRAANQVHPVVYVAPSSGYASASGPMAVSVVSPPLPSHGTIGTAYATPAPRSGGGLLDRFVFARGGAESPQAAPPYASVKIAPTPGATAAPVAPRPAPAVAAAPAGRNWQVGYPASRTEQATVDRRTVLSHASAIRQAAQPDPKQAAPESTEPQLPATTPLPPIATETSPASRLPPPVATVLPTSAKSEPIPALAKPASAQPLTPAKIESLVWSVCGQKVKAVKVEPSADGRHMVHVHPLAGMDQEVLTKLMNVPEITGSNLRLQIHLSN